MKRLKQLLLLPAQYHFWGSLFIVVFVAVIINNQITDRFGFANSDLYQDVMERWGAPILQPVPSVRYVDSGAVFSDLNVLPFAKQDVNIDAQMNYRKRGLVYFSGFDFKFNASYDVVNPEDHDIDAVFVFPVSMAKNEILLSNMNFAVNGESQLATLSKAGDNLIWTMRLSAAENVNFNVAFSGRGLDMFHYVLDPQLPVRDFKLAVNIMGGENFDYPPNVVPAHRIDTTDNSLILQWQFPSLESGIPLGVILPSEKSFDQLIATMLRRAWAPFVMMLISLAVFCRFQNTKLKIYESYLVASAYGFYFVLLAYLAAFMNFYWAYLLTTVIMVSIMLAHLSSIVGRKHLSVLTVILVLLLVIPTTAVILQGYTGLIYTISILLGLIVLMVLSSKEKFQKLFEPQNF